MISGSNDNEWVFAQLGAREHYAYARAIAKRGQLCALVTESWVPPGSPWRLASPRLAQRFHQDLSGEKVQAWTCRSVAFEGASRLLRRKDWNLVVSRNRWFQRKAVSRLPLIELGIGKHSDSTHAGRDVPVLFAYSYAALELFRWAKARGWQTVLGQIDPGELDEERMFALSLDEVTATPVPRAPSTYWEEWHEECQLADKIVVNSNWSRQLLLEAGVKEEKLRVVPLAFSSPPASYRRVYPAQFSKERPLRVLYLGQITRRKGIVELLAAARCMIDQPIEFWLVGPLLLGGDAQADAPENVRWFGSVPRAAVADWYKKADVFLFPTHSDGFGLTQLEAQSWRLPVISSRQCGEVVREGVNGTLLPDVSAGSISKVLRLVLECPSLLHDWEAQSGVEEKFSLESVGEMLTTAVAAE